MRSLLLALIIGVALLIATCAPPNADDPPMTDPTHTMAATDTMDTMDASSPFFTESPLPYHVPPFDQIDDAHYLPAFEQGMAQQLAEVDAILNSPEAPTFENTLVALEQSGRLLDRVATTFFNLAQCEYERRDGRDSHHYRPETRRAHRPHSPGRGALRAC